MSVTLPLKEPPVAPKSPGFWAEAWQRFRRQKLAMAALTYVICLALVALLAPAIAGTKPIVCWYKGNVYFPALGYLNPRWENPVFQRDGFRKRYPDNLKKNDPNSWAVWPLIYQDPYRRIREGEWPSQPGNPSGEDGRPNQYSLFGTDTRGIDVFAQMVHGTTIAWRVLLAGGPICSSAA
jgi:peptide/nickel transport system permease protein